MARIRTIKPEFWTSEQVMECSAMARLLFIGMWNFADDLGRLALSPKTIKAQVFPSDDMDSTTIRRMIDELSANDLVLIYEASGKEYLQITGWQHQKIDRPQPGKCPSPDNGYKPKQNQQLFDHSSNDRRAFDDGREGKGEESKVSEGKKETRASALGADDWPDDFREQFWSLYPNKVGKPKALAKLEGARKRKVPWRSIMDGLERYIRDKPADRAWLNPETFINQERWNDQPANAGHRPELSTVPPSQIDWDAVLTSFKRFGVWSKHAGPDLDSPECRAPADMLSKYGLLRSADHQIEAPRLKSMGGMN